MPPRRPALTYKIIGESDALVPGDVIEVELGTGIKAVAPGTGSAPRRPGMPARRHG